MLLPLSLLPLRGGVAASGRAAGGRSPGATRYAYTAADGTPSTLTVAGAGLACCAVEVSAAVALHPQRLRLLAPEEPTPPGLQVLVVAGTLTDALAPGLRETWDALDEPKAALAFGACATCGGPYWDSYSVTKGTDQLLPVDVVVPGCPPRPEALLAGLDLLLAGRP